MVDLLAHQGAGGLEDFHLLVPDRLLVEADWGLHRNQGQQLQLVVLHDVAQGAGALVVATPAFHAQLFGDRQLDTVAELVVPDRLEDGVGEAKGEDVLDRLLAQVVVDAEDLVLVEDRFDLAVQ